MADDNMFIFIKVWVLCKVLSRTQQLASVLQFDLVEYLIETLVFLRMVITFLEDWVEFFNVCIIAWVWFDSPLFWLNDMLFDAEVGDEVNDRVSDNPVQTKSLQSRFEKIVWR